MNRPAPMHVLSGRIEAFKIFFMTDSITMRLCGHDDGRFVPTVQDWAR